ncbi:MAG: hypothetical protein Q9220_000639 [cf. Caloplaca sp. 1 TL-2023]
MDFGKSDKTYRTSAARIQRRQVDSSGTASVATSGASPTTAPVSFPAPPSATPTATDAHQDVSFNYIDTAILPPQFPGVDSVTLHAPNVPSGVSFECKNCTLTGTIDILQGSISGNATTTASDNSEDDGFSWDQGSFTFQANNFSAHMEFGATVQPTVDLLTFHVPMPAIGIPGFQIPGIGVVGPIFEPAVVIGTKIGTQLDFTYGFNLTVPDNSSIILDLGDTQNSKITGFPDTQITTLPFTAQVDNIALTVSASFRPTLLLGVEVLTGTLGAGVFFNLPTISATVSQVAHVDSQCDPIPIADNSTTIDGILQDVFGSLTHIEPDVEFDFGVLAQGQVGQFGAEDIYTVFNTSLALPTACLEFDPKAKTLGRVTPSVEGKAIASATGTGSAARGIESPFIRVSGNSGVTLGLLLLGACAWLVVL